MEDYFAQLNSNKVTVLTPNRRLAATLHRLYNAEQIKNQLRCWETLDALPAINWIERLWTEHGMGMIQAQRCVLDAMQEQLIWEQLFCNKTKEHILQPKATAELLRSAYTLLKQWNVDLNHPSLWEYQNGFRLADWMIEFEQFCQIHHVVPQAQLPDLLTESILNQQIQSPERIALLGFTELAPQLNKLLAACSKQGCVVEKLILNDWQAEPVRLSFVDEEEEITTIARWAKALLEEHGDQISIGCVIPGLERSRERVWAIFADVFAVKHDPSAGQTLPFNISAGKPLDQYPIVQTALRCLNLPQSQLSLESFATILNSPFLGSAEAEYIQRAKFDAYLRRENMHVLSWNFILENTNTSLTQRCPLLAKHLKDYFAHIATQPKQQSFAAWASLFTQLLKKLGWPGERSIDSNEYQVIEHWLQLLNHLPSLDYVAEPVSFTQAHYWLEQLTHKTIFQPRTPTAAIQVLGVLEASGVPFDYAWLSAMNDLSWPPQPEPHPLIPKKLQRELDMPHATAEREFRYCQTLLSQFNSSAKNVIYSFAETENEYEYQVSPLIRAIPLMQIDELKLKQYQSMLEQIFYSGSREILVDEIAPPLSLEHTIVGGTTLIKHQALCPFKAFAEGRLNACELEQTRPGLQAKERGTITHKVLELIWAKLIDHEHLIRLNDSELKQIVDECIAVAVSHFYERKSHAKNYLNLEQQRLNKLLMGWLQIEKEREPFRVIAQELKAQLTLNQLKLSIRVDRIDELQDGRKLIIDYKTGKNNELNHLFSDRPEDPQLALYALLDPEHTVGIAFAQIATGHHLFKGMSRYDLDIKGIKPINELRNKTVHTWEDQLTQWNIILTKLSDAFCNGDARVDPKDQEQTCTWCALKSFCRIHEEVLS